MDGSIPLSMTELTQFVYSPCGNSEGMVYSLGSGVIGQFLRSKVMSDLFVVICLLMPRGRLAKGKPTLSNYTVLLLLITLIQAILAKAGCSQTESTLCY
ncbi:hypothetical protein DET47_11692 [Shewanella putrefaciens]|nr:hypothetical protein DET47_11692 [Shewanella putrefaciens]